MTNADTEALLRARLFQSGDPEVARSLGAVRPRARSLAGGDMIFEPGAEARSIFLVAAHAAGEERAAEPLVQVRLRRDGAEEGARFARIVRGDIFGEVEFVAAGLDPRPSTRMSSARALTPLRVIELSWSDLSRLFDLAPPIRARFLKLAARRFLDAIAAQRGQEDPDILLADWLVEFAADLGVAASHRVSFPKRVKQSDIADELGVTRETISRRLKEWERSGLLTASAGGLEVVDYARIVRIAGLRAGRDRAALARAVADVADKLDRGDLVDARNIAADMLRYYPASPELLHAVTLAAARSGDTGEAMTVLRGAQLAPNGNLEALRERVRRALENPFATMEKLAADDWGEAAFDEDADAAPAVSPREVERLTADLAALEARLLKDAAFDAARPPDRALAVAAGRAYEAIWRWSGSWYAGINAAAMALVAEDRKSAGRLAAEVLKRLPEHPKDYWAAATRAEALLVAGEREGGRAALAAAAGAPDATDSAKASTTLQLHRLSPLIGLTDGDIRSALGRNTIALVTGHLFRGAEMDAERQSQAAKRIRAEAEAIFAHRNVGHLYAALACGTDIVIAEAALQAGIPLHAVLPFPASRFAELSVDIGDPEGAEGGWRKRFDAVLAGAESLTIVDDEMPLDRDLDGHFHYGFRFMAGQALLRASVLQTECRLIAVTDGAAAASLAGASRAASDWLSGGRPLDRIEFPFARKAAVGRPRGASSFRPVVFVWSIAGRGGDREVAKSALKSKAVGGARDFAIVARSSRVGGEGTAIVAPTLSAALLLAEACAHAAGSAGDRAVRIICDFGPVLGPDAKPDEKVVARLRAGSDMPGFPAGQPLATLAFTAQAVAEFGEALDVRAVGRTEETRPGDANNARRRSGLPVFRTVLREAAR